jgi:hypothetical protein
MSLPGLLGVNASSVPADVPYLKAEPSRRARWRTWLNEHSGLKVGIWWQGSSKYSKDRMRSVPVALMAPLADVPGVRLVMMQIGDGREQLAEQAERLHALDPALVLDEQGEAFQDLAALICELDLVVSVDTVAAHLAGALAAPTWIALPYACDWRWLMEREDTPWYPTVRLFRQPLPGAWGPVFARMAEQLHDRSKRAPA